MQNKQIGKKIQRKNQQILKTYGVPQKEKEYQPKIKVIGASDASFEINPENKNQNKEGEKIYIEPDQIKVIGGGDEGSELNLSMQTQHLNETQQQILQETRNNETNPHTNTKVHPDQKFQKSTNQENSIKLDLKAQEIEEQRQIRKPSFWQKSGLKFLGKAALVVGTLGTIWLVRYGLNAVKDEIFPKDNGNANNQGYGNITFNPNTGIPYNDTPYHEPNNTNHTHVPCDNYGLNLSQSLNTTCIPAMNTSNIQMTFKEYCSTKFAGEEADLEVYNDQNGNLFYRVQNGTENNLYIPMNGSNIYVLDGQQYECGNLNITDIIGERTASFAFTYNPTNGTGATRKTQCFVKQEFCGSINLSKYAQACETIQKTDTNTTELNCTNKGSILDTSKQNCNTGQNLC